MFAEKFPPYIGKNTNSSLGKILGIFGYMKKKKTLYFLKAI